MSAQLYLVDVISNGKAMKNILRRMEFVLLNRNGKAPAHHVEHNLYSPEHFKKRLVIEKRRAERLNSISSLLVLRLKNHLHNRRNGGNFSKKHVEHLVRIISPVLRETDAVSLYKKNLILILLPDADNKGAERVCRRIMEHSDKGAKSGSSYNGFSGDDLEIQILSYPEKPARKDSPVEAAGNNGKEENGSEGHDTHDFKDANSSNFKKNYIESLNLCVSALNGSSVAIPIVDAFFWDQPAVRNLLVPAGKALKRAIDLFGAMAGLVLFSPVMLLAALSIKATSPGPVLFRQTRLGQRGKQFTFLKFRSMHDNCESELHQDYVKKLINGNTNETNNGSHEAPYYKMKADPRVTQVGRFLRKTSIDELPQLWNVLKGDMSLVGPRPPISYEVKEYQTWHYRRLVEAKPGITGLWQVSGRNRTTFDEMVRLDLFYAKYWSLRLDLSILLKTLKVMVMAEGR